MNDPTESIRRELVAAINVEPGSRESLEQMYTDVYDKAEVEAKFEVISFAAPFMIVRRKSDDAKGTLMFQHSPRFYFEFTADEDYNQ